jgi:FkbM family methyltransferase
MVDYSVAVNNDQNAIAKPGRFRFSTRRADPTHRAYQTREWHEEANSEFFNHVQRELKPELILDIGGNHGVAAVIAGAAMPQAHVVCVEPIPELYPYIEYNLVTNDIKSFEIIRGIVGEKVAEGKTFHLNPNGSGDSRVVAPDDKWEKISVVETSVTELIQKNGADKSLYIKVDTQGYEPFVMRGAEAALTKRSNWVMKSEFGPKWIENQGENPKDFLLYLLDRYNVTEYPGRYNFKIDYTDLISTVRLRKDEVDNFLAYVTSHYRDGLGWVDIIVSPKTY